MNEVTLYIKVKVKVKSELPLYQIIAEFEQDSLYNFESTENVEVIETEYLETTPTQPT